MLAAIGDRLIGDRQRLSAVGSTGMTSRALARDVSVCDWPNICMECLQDSQDSKHAIRQRCAFDKWKMPVACCAKLLSIASKNYVLSDRRKDRRTKGTMAEHDVIIWLAVKGTSFTMLPMCGSQTTRETTLKNVEETFHASLACCLA